MQDNLLLDELFPTVVGRAYCRFWFDIKDEYLKHINKKYVFNEKGYCFDEFYKDTKLKKLNNWITKKVNEFAALHKFKTNFKPFERWCITYVQGSYQPYHILPGAYISTNFFLSADLEDAATIFKSPYQDQQNVLKLAPHLALDEKYKNRLTDELCSYKPMEGMLYIFRSFVEHGTGEKNSEYPRIIFSYNYALDKKNKRT